MMEGYGEERSHVNPVRSMLWLGFEAFIFWSHLGYSCDLLSRVITSEEKKTDLKYFIRSSTPRQYGGLNLIYLCDAQGSAI